jgi:hypothetical protein
VSATKVVLVLLLLVRLWVFERPSLCCFSSLRCVSVVSLLAVQASCLLLNSREENFAAVFCALVGFVLRALSSLGLASC